MACPRTVTDFGLGEVLFAWSLPSLCSKKKLMLSLVSGALPLGGGVGGATAFSTGVDPCTVGRGVGFGELDRLPGSEWNWMEELLATRDSRFDAELRRPAAAAAAAAAAERPVPRIDAPLMELLSIKKLMLSLSESSDAVSCLLVLAFPAASCPSPPRPKAGAFVAAGVGAGATARCSGGFADLRRRRVLGRWRDIIFLHEGQ